MRQFQIKEVLFICLFLYSCSHISNNNNKEVEVSRVDTLIITDYLYSSILPINSPQTYYHKDDSMVYELSINRLNENELTWNLNITKNHQILFRKIDTTTLDIKGGEYLRLRYGHVIPGIKFIKTQKNEFSTKILIDTTNQSADFITFLHQDYGKTNSNIPRVPPLKASGVDEPYKGYLRSILNELTYTHHDYRQYPSSRLKEKIELLENELSELLKEIKGNENTEEIRKDTFLLDIANYYEMTKVTEMLLEFGFSNRKRISKDQIQYIPVEKISEFRGIIEFTREDKVLNNRFEKINFDSKPNSELYIAGFDDFCFFNDSTVFLKYHNKIVTTMHGSGFESVSHIITIWNIKEDTIYLETILDKLLFEGIGGVIIDTILPYDSNKNIIIGNSGGGDGGDVWGSLWIGVWNKPRSLKVVYIKKWIGINEDYTNIDFKILPNNTIRIIENKIWFERLDGEYRKNKRILSYESLNLDSLVKLEHIQRQY